MLSDTMVVLNGNSNHTRAADICSDLGLEPGRAEVTRFPDGEISVSLGEDVRGKDVFIVQSTCPPVNENLMALLVMLACSPSPEEEEEMVRR